MKDREIHRAILVTGGGSGIGAATCRLLASPGTAVLVHARNNEMGCEHVATQVEHAGEIAQTLCSDLTETGSGAHLVARALESFGRLDALVANAGFPFRGNLPDIERPDLDYCFSAMPGAFLEMVKAALPSMRRASSGRVVAVSAHTAHLFRAHYPTFPASAAAKSALKVLARTTAIDTAADGVTVNVVVPGLIIKDRGHDSFLSKHERETLVRHIPMQRFGTTEEVAAVIAFLLSPTPSYITNQVIHVNGGLT